MIQGNMMQQCQAEFIKLKSRAELPPLIELKLSFLLSLIKQKPIEQKIIDNLPDYQRISLEQMNKETQVGVFCCTMNCFSGKQNIVYFQNERAYLRKDKLINFWNECLISCDSKFLRIKMRQKKQQLLELYLDKMKISRSTNKYKGKNVFIIIDSKTNKKYVLGFQTETGCQRIHQTLKEIMAQLHKRKHSNGSSLKQQRIEQKKRQFSEMDLTESQRQNSFEQLKNSNLNQPILRNMNERQDDQMQELDNDGGLLGQDYLKLFKDQVDSQQFNSDEGFHIERNFNGGRLMSLNKQKTKLKCTVLVNSTNALKIIQSYFKLNQWNSEVEQYETLSRIDANSYLVYIKFKKRSYFSYQRDSVCIFSAFKKSNQRYYIVLKTVEDTSEKSNSNIKANITQLIQLNTKSNQQRVSLITIIQKLNYLGYTSESENQKNGIQFLKNIQFFPKFVTTQSIIQSKQPIFSFDRFLKSNSKQKFNQGHTKICDKSISFQEYQQVERSQEPLKTDKRPFNKQNLLLQQENQYHLQKYMLQTYTWKQKPDPMLLQLLRKNLQERYYLKHHFQTDAKYDVNRLNHSSEQPNNFIFQNGNWKFNSKGHICFVNEEVLKDHNNVLKFVIKKLGSNLMSGESLMNLPLPVQIFQGQSILQRYAYSFGYMPKLLIPASQDDDVSQQIKKILLFLIGHLKLLVNISKPFNPTIGQTLQATCGGIPIYLQQISHHPPISSIYVNTQDFEISMNYDMFLGIGMNAAHVYCRQLFQIKMKRTNRKYYIQMPNCDLEGLMYGDRTVKFVDKMFLYQPQTLHFAQVSFQKTKKGLYQSNREIKGHQIFGGIFKVKRTFGQKFMKDKKRHKFDGLRPEKITQTVCDIKGCWLGDVFFGNEKRMTLLDPLPNKIQLEKFVLPSDSNLRPDIYYKRMGDLTKAQQEKQLIENEQRRYRKLRKEMRRK